LGNRWHVGSAITNFACLAAAQGQWERAARLAGAAEALLAATNTLPIPLYEAALAEALEATRRVLSESTYEVAQAEGRAMTPDEAIAYALEAPAPD
jgi:hypothetical protein